MAFFREWWQNFKARLPWNRVSAPVEVPLAPVPEVDTTRHELEDTRRRLDRASRRLLRMIDIEIEARTQE